MQKVLTAIRALPANYPRLSALDPLIVYLMGCMKFAQFCCTWRALEDPERFCPFCPAERVRRKRMPLVNTGAWMVLKNEFPRADTKRMLLIIPTHHVVNPNSLNAGDWEDLRYLFNFCYEKSGVKNGALLMRFGDPRDHAGTIEHLHWNVIQPVREGGCSLPIAKKVEGPYGHKEDYARLLDFVAETGRRGGVAWLFSPEGIVETQPTIA